MELKSTASKTNPGNADRNAAGYRAAGSIAGPHGGRKIGDQVKNGAVAGAIMAGCGSRVWWSPDFGDGERRRFRISATMEKWFTLWSQNIRPQIEWICFSMYTKHIKSISSHWFKTLQFNFADSAVAMFDEILDFQRTRGTTIYGQHTKTIQTTRGWSSHNDD